MTPVELRSRWDGTRVARVQVWRCPACGVYDLDVAPPSCDLDANEMHAVGWVNAADIVALVDRTPQRREPRP